MRERRPGEPCSPRNSSYRRKNEYVYFLSRLLTIASPPTTIAQSCMYVLVLLLVAVRSRVSVSPPFLFGVAIRV